MARQQRCDGIRRRDLVRIGGLSALGFGLGDYLRLGRAHATDSKPPANAKSCILIWMDGGPSHLETFDPKPDAPKEVRGPFATIATNVGGIRVNECLEKTASVMDKISIIRSMTSPLGEHDFGTHYLMTGYKPSAALEHPTFGSTLAHLRRNSSVLPPHIAVPKFGSNVSGNGFLPSTTRPFSVGGNPDAANFKVRDLDFYKGLDLARLDRRKQIVNAFDEFSRAKDAAETLKSDPDLERAYNLIASPSAKDAFKLSEEPESVRSRYGRGGGNSIGQSCLLARRLVERGVPFVTVNSSGWDTHQNINQLKQRFPTDRNAQLPSFDRAFSALIQDLSERGMLDETLVVVMGEFGRTPKINAAAGRDHWPNVFSVALAGGGVVGGQVIGSSNPLGEFPADHAVTPSDLASTIYTLLGIDPAYELHTRDGRPVRVAPDGAKVVAQLIG
ncbi:MAG: DUF1501 domain-containing protein [Planctomycetota bacterium]|nr:DUF1501 domain-containing protein [Planctomycetota bacterium]